MNLAWQGQAACATEPDIDPTIFFPTHNDNHSATRSKVNQARKVCFRCPVRLRCLDHALAEHEEGIWGGTTDYERRGIKRKLNRTVAS